jgi:hypothetical protein
VVGFGVLLPVYLSSDLISGAGSRCSEGSASEEDGSLMEVEQPELTRNGSLRNYRRGVLHEQDVDPEELSTPLRSRSQPPCAERNENKAKLKRSVFTRQPDAQESVISRSPDHMSVNEVMHSSLIGTNFDDSLEVQKEFQFLSETSFDDDEDFSSPTREIEMPFSAPPCSTASNVFTFDRYTSAELPAISEDGREDDSRPCSSRQAECDSPFLEKPFEHPQDTTHLLLDDIGVLHKRSISDNILLTSTSTINEEVDDSPSASTAVVDKEHVVNSDHSLSLPQAHHLDRAISSSTPSISENVEGKDRTLKSSTS